MTVYFDKLIDNYLPTDSGWTFHPDNVVELPTVESDNKLVIDTTNPLPNAYSQLMFSTTSSTGNAYTYYLNLITSTNGELPQIVKDANASNAKAIKIGANTKLIFKTNYPYNKDRLKKIVCRCRKEAGATASLRVGVISVNDEAYITPSGSIGTNDFYDVTINSTTTVSETYNTYIGYVLDTTTNAYTPSVPDVDFPIPLYDGTTDIALVIEVTDGIGNYYIDSIELQDTENSIADLPNGKYVVNSLEGLTDDNQLSPVEKTYIKTLMSEIDAEYTGIVADGTDAGVSDTLMTELETKYNALHAIVVPLLVDMATASDIDSTFDLVFDEYYEIKTSIQSEVAKLNNASVEIIVDSTTISINGYGNLLTSAINIQIVTEHIPISSISVTRSDGGVLLKENDSHYILNCASVEVSNLQIVASGTYLGKEYSTFIDIIKVIDVYAPSRYFGKINYLPDVFSDGTWLVKGDYFMVSEQFTNGTQVYKIGTIWEYDGGGWVLSNNAMKALDAMDDYVSLAEDADDGVFCQVVAKRVIAQQAVIEELGTKEITLKTGGKIKSEIQIPGVTGFEIKADGSADFINASMVSGLFTGTIDSPPLTTTEESDAEDPVTFDSFTHWRSADVYNALKASLTEGVWHSISGTYNTVAIIKASINQSTINIVEYDRSGSSSSSGSVTINTTITFATHYKISVIGREVSFPQGADDERFRIYVNGVEKYYGRYAMDFDLGELAVNDVVRVTLNGGDWTLDPDYLIQIKAVVLAGVTLRSATTQYNFTPNYFYAASTNNLEITSPSIDTGSTTFRKYAKATAFLAGVSSYAVNMFKSAQGTVSINGVNRTLSGVMKTATGMTVFHNAGSVALVATTADPGTTGYYNISGSYKIISTVEGAATMNLNAKKVDTYSIGTTVRYLNMTAKTMVAEAFDNSSARDKKKDITPFLGSALDILKQVQVVNYRYKTETGEYLHTGFIADDTPDPLTGTDHNSMSLGDNIGMLIKAVQELYALIKEIQND